MHQLDSWQHALRQAVSQRGTLAAQVLRQRPRDNPTRMRAAAAASATPALRARRARVHTPGSARADALRAGRGGLLATSLAALLLLARADVWEPCSEAYAVACYAAFEAPEVSECPRNGYRGPPAHWLMHAHCS